MPEVTIFLPVLTENLNIDKTIYSILSQNFSDFELIIISTHKIDIDEYNDERISLFVVQNKSIPSMLNSAIKEIESKYVCFVEEHDVLMFYALKQRVLALDVNENLIASYGLGFDSDDEFEILQNDSYNMFMSFSSLPSNELYSILQMEIYPSLSSLMIKTDVIKQQMFNEKFKVNYAWDLFVKLMSSFGNEQVYQLKDPIYLSSSEYLRVIKFKRNYARLFLNETIHVLDNYFKEDETEYFDIRNSCYKNAFVAAFIIQNQFFKYDLFSGFLLFSKYLKKNMELKGAISSSLITNLLFSNFINSLGSDLTRKKEVIEYRQ